MAKGYDPACLDLAELFLERPGMVATETDIGRARRLAQLIQDTIEAFLEEEADDAREEERHG